MKTWLCLAGVALVLAGCECGPGVACKVDGDCKVGYCEKLGGSSGYCVAIDAGGVGGGVGGGGGGGAGGGGGVDAGAPVAGISTSALDFGAVGCGRGEVYKDLPIINAGNAPLTFSAALSGSGFSVDAGSGTVDVGATGHLFVAAKVAATSAAGVDQSGTLSVTTNDPGHAKVDVPLKLQSAGVTLALALQAQFGTVSVNTDAPPLPLTLTNLGNVDATVGFAAPVDSQFSLTWSGAPAMVTIPAGMSAPGLSAGFKPMVTTASSSSAAITVVEAICGQSAMAINFSGQGTSGVVGLSSNSVSFGSAGRVDCGTKAADKQIVLSNTGNQGYSWTATLGKGAASPFTVVPSGGTVPAGTGMTPITISTTAIPAQASTAVDAFGDTLTIVTDAANDSAHLVSLHQTAQGAVLSFAPGALDFGSVPINSTANAPFSVVNDGNLSANVTLTSSNASFSVTPPAPAAVVGGTSGAYTAGFSPGASTAAQTAMLSMSLDGGEVLCAPLPAAMTMAGQGSNGSVSYTPVGLDFGQVSCASTAAPQTVTFSNNGNQSYTVTPTLGKGATSPYAISMAPDSGVVAQDGGSLIITVTPKPVPFPSPVTPNLYGDTLTVGTDVSGDSPHDITLRETARGSIFTISVGSIDFGTVAVGVNGSSQFTVSNIGNAAGALRFSTTQSVFSFPPVVPLNAGTPAVVTASFSPLAATMYGDSATVGIDAGTVLCDVLPKTTISLAGTGTNSNVVMVSAGSLSFGNVSCGTTAAPQNLTVMNNSVQALAISLTLAGGASAPYTVSGPASIPANMSGVVTVTPKAIPSTSSTAADAFSGSLTIRSVGGPVDESHVVALHETAEGAVLTFDKSSLTFSSTSTQGFNVNNAGNLNAAYTLSLTGASQFTVGPLSGTANAGGSVASTAHYARPLIAFPPYNASVTLATSAVRCAPLPAQITLTGN